MDTKIVQMFGCGIKNSKSKSKAVQYSTLLEKAMQTGYIVDPECSNEDILDFLEEQEYNPNSTFYKTWNDVTSKSRWELLVDQMLHYYTAYKKQLEEDESCEVYIPNSNPVSVIKLQHYKTIKAVEPEFIYDKILAMLESGIALNETTIDIFIEFLKEYNFINDINININKIKNKEAQAQLCYLTSSYSKLDDPFALLRCIVYSYTKSALLIKSQDLIKNIKYGNSTFSFTDLTAKQLTLLSTIFYRYKPLFLAMKKRNESSINKIRRLAKKNHKPFKIGFWESCLLAEDDSNAQSAKLDIALKKLPELDNFHKIRIMQAIKERLLIKDSLNHVYNIRNGKIYVRTNYKVKTNDLYLRCLYGLLEDSVIQHLSQFKGQTFYRNEKFHITAPSSEKSFIGNIPVGSYVDLSDRNNVLGIYWRNEWGASDLDLHMCDVNGFQYGWNSNYYSKGNGIIYSGDVIDANPEASELFYIEKAVPDSLININKYTGNPNMKFKLFIATDPSVVDKIKHKRSFGNDTIMIDPNNIVFETMFDFSGSQLSLASIVDSKLYFAIAANGSSRVSNFMNIKERTQAIKAKMVSYVDMENLLLKAGFTITDNPENATIDLSDLKKDQLVKLFA